MRNFQDIFPELTRTLNFNFQDFPGGVGTLRLVDKAKSELLK